MDMEADTDIDTVSVRDSEGPKQPHEMTREEFEQALEEDLEKDPFVSESFNAIDYINKLFPSEPSLVGVDAAVAQLKRKIRRVDGEIISAIREQSTTGTQAKQDLAEAQQAIQELFAKIKEIKRKAEQSEEMVQEICRDIKKLDFAKKHLTTTITALRRLAMLVSAVETLEQIASKKEYRDTANLVEAVAQLMKHFEPFGQIPKIAELKGKFEIIKKMVRQSVFEDFSRMATLGTGDDRDSLGAGAPSHQVLTEACLVVDALDPGVKEDLVATVLAKELVTYKAIFQGTDSAKLDKVDRRYAQIRRQLRSSDESFTVFPVAWGMNQKLCMEFCTVTRAQLSEVLQEGHGSLDVAMLLQALQRTLEFEQEMQERYGASLHGDEDDDYDEDRSHAASIRRKYERMRDEKAATEGKTDEELAVEAANAQMFKGSISTCFEPHLSVYVELEEKTLMEQLDLLVMQETWEVDDASSNKVLNSAAQIFLHIKRSLKRCSALTRNQTLFNLNKVFMRVLQAYATKLSNKLPKTGSTLTAGVGNSSEWRINVSDKDERAICLIIVSAEYCQSTVGNLGDSLRKVLDPAFEANVDTSEVEDAFSAVVSRALSILVLSVESKVEQALVNMTRIAWDKIEGVGDQSEYVNQISLTFASSVPTAGCLLSSDYFRFFCDKFTASFIPRFYGSILRCKRLSEPGAQQMLLDTHAVKTLLLELPSLGSDTAPGSYVKSVNKEMAKSEALLKVVLSPLEGIAETFIALVPTVRARWFTIKPHPPWLLKEEWNCRVHWQTSRNYWS